MPSEPHGDLHVHVRAGQGGVVGAPEGMEVERLVFVRAGLDQAVPFRFVLRGFDELGLFGSARGLQGEPGAFEARERTNDARDPNGLA